MTSQISQFLLKVGQISSSKGSHFFQWQSLKNFSTKQNAVDFHLVSGKYHNACAKLTTYANSCFVNQIAFPIWKALIGTSRQDVQRETSGLFPDLLQMSCCFATWTIENETFRDAGQNNIQALC